VRRTEFWNARKWIPSIHRLGSPIDSFPNFFQRIIFEGNCDKESKVNIFVKTCTIDGQEFFGITNGERWYFFAYSTKQKAEKVCANFKDKWKWEWLRRYFYPFPQEKNFALV
jgi:hypothetical protein